MDFCIWMSSFHLLGHVFGDKDVCAANAVLCVIRGAGSRPIIVYMLMRLLVDAPIATGGILGITFERHDGHEHTRGHIASKMVQIEQNLIFGVSIIDGDCAVSLMLAPLVFPDRRMS